MPPFSSLEYSLSSMIIFLYDFYSIESSLITTSFYSFSLWVWAVLRASLRYDTSLDATRLIFFLFSMWVSRALSGDNLWLSIPCCLWVMYIWSLFREASGELGSVPSCSFRIEAWFSEALKLSMGYFLIVMIGMPCLLTIFMFLLAMFLNVLKLRAV